MRAFLQHPKVRLCRTIFRWMRICVWFALFLVVTAVAYLHLYGLPDMLKRPVLAHLRDRGWDVGFSEVYLGVGHGPAIWIRNPVFRRISEKTEPLLTADLADLRLDPRDLLHGRVTLTSLEVSGGRMQFPAEGETGHPMALNNIHLRLDFLTNDVVTVSDSDANFAGLAIGVNGQLSHGMAVRDWKFPSAAAVAGKPGLAGPGGWRQWSARISSVVRHVHFPTAPRMDLVFQADGRDPNTVQARLSLAAPAVITPWGEAHGLDLLAICENPLATNRPVLRMEFNADAAYTPAADVEKLWLTTLVSRGASSNLDVVVHFEAADAEARWSTNAVHVTPMQWDGHALLDGARFRVLAGGATVRAEHVRTPWASARALNLSVQEKAAEPPAEAGPDWGPWRPLAGCSLDWTLNGEGIVAPKLELDTLALDGQWRAPSLALTGIHAGLYGGKVGADASLDVASRELRVNATADFDAHHIDPLLGPVTRRLFAQYAWDTPPHGAGCIRLVFPAWTNRHPDWNAEVVPTLQIYADVKGSNVSFRGVRADYAETRLTYTNRIWDLPRTHVVRRDGELFMRYTNNDATHAYYFQVTSKMDPKALQPLVPEAQRHWFDEAAFTVHPDVRGEVWGHWGDTEDLAFRGDFSATNFTAHGERVDAATGRLECAGGAYTLTGAHLARGAEVFSADIVRADFRKKSLAFTNACSTFDAAIVPRIFGKDSPKFLDVVKFRQPPTVRATGYYLFPDPLATDIRFHVSGRDFHWTKLKADTISGDVAWRARDVALTNVNARLYGAGVLVGQCRFDYQVRQGTDFSGACQAHDVNLPALVRGLTGRTNHLEGMLDADIYIDKGNSENPRSVVAEGVAHVHDATLWDIKVFGIFSDALNAIAPGAGNSRAYDAAGSFAVTNGVLDTEDLTVHSTGLQVRYRGTMDLIDRKIDARVEAEPFRDTPGLGPALSVVMSPFTKLFEYKLTGSYDNPSKEPVYIPKPLMLLLRPFHTLKELFGGDADDSSSFTAPEPPRGK